MTLRKLAQTMVTYPLPNKTHLLVKDHLVAEATELFNVCTEGTCYLGEAIGKASFLQSFVQDKVDAWVCEIRTLSKIALDQPQASLVPRPSPAPVFDRRFCILQAIKNWSRRRPGNEAT